MVDPSRLSTAQLIGQGVDDVRVLLRTEIELAKAGIVEEMSARLVGLGLIVGAGALILPALAFLLLALALWLPGSPELNFTLVGVALIAIAGIGLVAGAMLVKNGRRRANAALDAVKEDARWARERVKR